MMNNFQMLSISQWASKHTLTARTMLVTSHIMLTILAVTMGKFMSNLAINIHPAFLYSSMLLFSIAFIGYPIKKRNIPFSKRYRKQKSFDALLAFSTFLMILCQSNLSASSSSIPTASAWAPKRANHSIIKKTETRKQKGRILHFLESSKNYSSTEKTLITILAIIGAAGLLYLLAALACTISCNGAEGAAIAVGIVGTAAIIFLFVKLMKHLNKNPSITRNK
jgi:hypothetical protein